MLDVSIRKKLGPFKLFARFTADKGVLSVLGSSGSGKSVSLKCIAGLLNPDEGKICLNGKTLFDGQHGINIPSRERNIGFVFQNYALFPHLTVAENIGFGLKGCERAERRERVEHMVRRMRLEGFERRYPSRLSGGQQQRVALGRTLVTAPEVLLLDEPFSALDGHTKQLLQDELISAVEENFHGVAILVTHNLEEAYRIGSDIMIMDAGKIVQKGPKDSIIDTPDNLAAARLTGCKNIIDVDIVEDDGAFLVLKSGGLVFTAHRPAKIPLKPLCAGIRAHHIDIVPENGCAGNTIRGVIQDIIPSAYRLTVRVICSGTVINVVKEKRTINGLILEKGKTVCLHIDPAAVFLVAKEQQ